MEIKIKCNECKHDYITNIETGENYVQTEIRPDDEFQEFLTFNKCPECHHCQDYNEYHSCVATSHHGGERWCGWCDRDMTPTSYYI